MRPGPPAGRSPTPSWSAWPSPRCCCATTTNTIGCGPRPPGSGTCSPGCCPRPSTTGGCAWRRLLEAALRWLADHTPATAELLRLLDGTPVVLRPVADHRQALGPVRLRRLRPRHLPPPLLLGRQAAAGLYPRGTVTGFGLANPKLVGEREALRQLLDPRPTNRSTRAPLLVSDKGLAGQQIETVWPSLELLLMRPARTDEPDPGHFPNWLRQRVEAIIWTLKHQLGLDRHGGRIPAGLWARVVQRLLALNAAIWFNWQIGAPIKRSLIAYDH